MKDDLYNAILAADGFDGGDSVYDIDGSLVFIELQNIWIKRLRYRQINPKLGNRTLFFLRCQGVRADLECDAGNSPSHGEMHDNASLFVEGGSGHNITAHAFGQGKISHIAIHNTSDSEYNLSVDLGEYRDPSATNDVAQAIWLNRNTDCKLPSPRVVGKGQKFTRAIVGGGNVRVTGTDFYIEGTDQGWDWTGSDGNIDCILDHGLVRNCLTWPVKLANSAVGCRVKDVEAVNSGAFVASGPSQPDQTHKTQDCEFIGCKAVNPRGWGFRVMTSLYEHSYPRGIKFIDCEGSFHSELPGNELIRCVGPSEGFAVRTEPTPAAPVAKPQKQSNPLILIAAVLAVLLIAFLIL